MTADHLGLPLVSIGIPTYNRASKNLRQCLESALAQDYENLEIIVSDNCSTDDTSQLMSEYQDSRLRYKRHDENIGANRNFNYCLEAAEGQYFLLLHDDDAIDPTFVSTCIESLNGGDAGFVRTGVRIIDGSGKKLRDNLNEVNGEDLPSFFRSWFSGGAAVFLCSTLFNRELLLQVGGFKSRHSLLEDVVAILNILELKLGVNIPDVRATFRKHEEQRTYQVDVMQWCEEFGDVLARFRTGPLRDEEELFETGRAFFKKICLSRLRFQPNFVKKRFNRWRVGRYFERKAFP